MADKRIFLFHGGDSLQKEATIQKVSRHYFGEEPVDRFKFIAKNDPMAKVLDELLSFSLFAENKIVLFEQCEQIPKNELDALTAYLQAPRGDSPFLLFAESQKGVSKAILNCLAKDQIRKLEKTPPGKIRDLVVKKSQEKSVQLQPKALQLFMELCGGDAEMAMRELDKILLWAGDGAEVSVEDCQNLLQTEHEMDVWAITRAVAEKNAESALHALEDLLTHGDEPVQIVGRLGGTFRKMYHCKTLEQEKVSFHEWSSRTGLYGYSLKKNREQMGRFSLNALRGALQLIRRADEDIKGGKSLPLLVVQRLAIDLCQVG